MTKIEIIFNGERLYGLSEVLAYLDKQRECISEFEKENAELKQLVEWLDMAIDSDIPIADKLAELEKENAELKEKVGKYQIGMFDEIEKRDRRITKAKEIIREFVEWANWQGSNCPSFKSIQNKAEQFLKDLEK